MADRSIVKRITIPQRIKSLPNITSGSPFDGGHGTRVKKVRVRRLKNKVRKPKR